MKYSQTAINYYLRKYYFNYYFVKHFNWRVKSKKFSDYVQRYKKLHKNDNRVQKFWTRRRKGRNIHNLLSDTVIVEVVTDIVNLLLEARKHFLHIQGMSSRRK